jgi:alpha-ribazole phosphatase/probable phosphoglycerate mutase
MKHLILIRHAETDMAGTFCGQSDPPVNARGHEQIQTLLKTLAAEPIESVYTSDLQRAVTTAKAIAHEFGVPCVIRPRLREIGFGEWEGLGWKEIELKDPAYAQRWVDAWPRMAAPGGESLEAFEKRVTDEIESLLSRPEPEHAAVVTHAGVMRLLLRTLCSVEDEQRAWEQTAGYCSFFRYAGEVGR